MKTFTLELDRVSTEDGAEFIVRALGARPPVAVRIPFPDWIELEQPDAVYVTVDTELPEPLEEPEEPADEDEEA